MSVGERLEKLESRVRRACEACGRDPRSVRVLAVSKLQDINKIREAYAHGQRDFGENYVQEAVGKLDQLHSLPVDWHFIGRIQSNKVKPLSGRFAYIHSIDRPALAEALNRLAARTPQKIFLQFNVAGEAGKGGVGEVDLEKLAEFCMTECSHLSVQGLMIMPPLNEDSRPYFRRAREWQEKIRERLSVERRRLHPFDQLSMGTSHDFVEAIAEGATWIRIGSEIFGAREEKT
jgi:pyridoxal phosphate enzyme (YggS family)